MIADNLVVNGLIKVTSQAEVNTLTVDQVNDVSGEDISQLSGTTDNVQDQIDALATSYEESIENSTEFKTEVANAVNSLSDEPNLNSESTLEQYVTAISLLGGKNYKGRLTASDDLDNVSDDGFYDIVSTDQPVNIPSDCSGANACVEVFNLPEIETIYQRCHRFQGGVFTYSRRKFNGAWSNWVAYTFGVKGNAEASYRSGNVNITPENIGAISTSGGTVTGTISSSLSTHSYLAGNKGTTIINSTAGAGVYVMLAKMNSTNGYFTHGVYNNEYVLYYTDKATVDADTNSYTKAVRLLDESGSSSFPGELNVAGCINVAYPQAIRVRHVDGSNNGELYLNYNNPTQKVHIGNAGYGFTNNGSIYNGYTYRNYLPRVAKSCAYQPGASTGIWEEFTAGDSYSLPTNAWYHIFTGQGADANYNTQLALGMTTTNIAYRNRNGGTWGSWQTILTSGNYSSYLGSADYPTGFAYRTTSSEWGNTTGTHVTGWHIEGCEFAFMKNNPSSGKLSAKIDGYFYQNEGTYRVLDTSDLGGLMPNPWANNTLYTIGDDVAMGDGNIAGCLVIKGLNGATGIQFNPYSGSTPQKISIDGSGLMSITGNLSVEGTINGKCWWWSGQGGQPNWIWGGNDGTNMYVYNPSNFSVNYASSAGNADTLDGNHATAFASANHSHEGVGVLGYVTQFKFDNYSSVYTYYTGCHVGTDVGNQDSLSRYIGRCYLVFLVGGSSSSNYGGQDCSGLYIVWLNSYKSNDTVYHKQYATNLGTSGTVRWSFPATTDNDELVIKLNSGSYQQGKIWVLY